MLWRLLHFEDGASRAPDTRSAHSYTPCTYASRADTRPDAASPNARSNTYSYSHAYTSCANAGSNAYAHANSHASCAHANAGSNAYAHAS